MKEIKGQIIGGSFDRIFIRQKKGEQLEIGELLISENNEQKVLFQVVDLTYSSQVSRSNIEYISGMKIEKDADIELMDSDLRYYVIAELKSILAIDKKKIRSNKSLAPFFSEVRETRKEDIDFFVMPKNPLFIGKLRSGSKIIDTDLFVDGKDVLSHHVLVAATTGRGKSNLTSCILWNLVDQDYAGILVLDPHDEYYGRNNLGLKDHPQKKKVIYYTPFNIPPGCKTLKINISKLRPEHFHGVIYFTDAQTDGIYTYFKKFKSDWVKMLLLGEEIKIGDKNLINEATLNVLRRKLMSLLNISVADKDLLCHGIFDETAGETTIEDICALLEDSNLVIVDTSNIPGNLEILVGSMISSEILSRYRRHKLNGTIGEKPVISIVIEEAPRVLGKEALEQGPNIFATIAREGRKFKVGVFAITQLPSLIPKEILANMNTKIILGIEMASERQAIIDSAAQDLTSDNRNIASLDKGEALISSNFTKFATPIKVPFFPDLVKKKDKKDFKQDYSGINFE